MHRKDLLKYFKRSSEAPSEGRESEASGKEAKNEESLVLDKKDIDPEVLFPTQLRSYYASAEF